MSVFALRKSRGSGAFQTLLSSRFTTVPAEVRSPCMSLTFANLAIRGRRWLFYSHWIHMSNMILSSDKSIIMADDLALCINTSLWDPPQSIGVSSRQIRRLRL